ncbi:hypothetical protein LRS74_31760 [Streptomyces sp. LX-29]|uniref:baeRF2 domain-containing protein n=1 Tax=Streptomyces sp. LX-29 TaxID=2900152 RepID=UPI00240E32AB|nr:hypothetical protein [Streptomyces sp. LX-29]WFB11107.1 hypothetical protein LRS74_31760 [Streptomyces sp. LX-29]
MQLSFLDRLYEQPGPWASVYLDTSRDIDDPDKAIALRWRHLRDELVAGGADAATVDALADAAGADREVAGRHGQALFATRGRLVLVEELPEPPPRDVARFGPLPHALPVAVQYAPDIPYTAIVLERLVPPDADGTEEVVVEVESGRWPMSRALPGPSDLLRVAVEDWRLELPGIVRHLAELAGQADAEAIVVGADPGNERLQGALVNRLSARVPHGRRVVRSVAATDPTPSPPESGRALLEQELSELLTGRLRESDHERLERYQAQRARRPDTSEGMGAVVTALQRGQADTVLLNDPPRLPSPLFVGTEPAQIASAPGELEAFGSSTIREEDAGDALLWSTVGTGAQLTVVPQDTLALRDGVGTLLRHG